MYKLPRSDPPLMEPSVKKPVRQVKSWPKRSMAAKVVTSFMTDAGLTGWLARACITGAPCGDTGATTP